MDQWSAMRAYRAIVESGSFTRAAERLGTSHSTVSRLLRQLETHLGARLLHRDSRNLSLTEAGARYYRDCVDILERTQAAEQRASADPRQPSGTLRISLPHAIGALELKAWLPAFLQRYPRIDLDLCCDDRRVDLVKGGYDMAIRISAALRDSDLVARELAVSDRVLVAAPHYLAQQGLPRTPDDLRQHRLLAYSGDGTTLALSRRDAGTPQAEDDRVECDGRLRLDSILSLHAAVLASLGIGAFTEFTVREDLAAGRLIRVLPQYRAGRRRYFALYPNARQLAPKVRAYSDFMRAHYAAAGAS